VTECQSHTSPLGAGPKTSSDEHKPGLYFHIMQGLLLFVSYLEPGPQGITESGLCSVPFKAIASINYFRSLQTAHTSSLHLNDDVISALTSRTVNVPRLVCACTLMRWAPLCPGQSEQGLHFLDIPLPF
jgi:hypothetical protein